MRNLSVILITALTFSSFAQAIELTCESSHLSTPTQNLEQIANNLAKLRLEIYQMPSSQEKMRADQEFRSKYVEFESLVGDNSKAQKLFAAQMKLSSQTLQTDETAKKEKKQKEKESEAVSPVALARRMEFHWIKPGYFKMGHYKSIRHMSYVEIVSTKVDVEITKPFAMMATPVTQMMWARIKRVLGEADSEKLNPSQFKNGTDEVAVDLDGVQITLQPDHPVERVSSIDVNEWIHGLNQLSNSKNRNVQAFLKTLIPGHKKGDIYDLPSEAQWEFVMRNRGNANENYFDRKDEREMTQYAWTTENSDGHTHPVAMLEPRLIDGQPFYDLEGNVSEWTKDQFDNKLPSGIDPVVIQGPYPEFRITRGGSIQNGALDITSYKRTGRDQNERSGEIGFRLVRTRP